MTDRYAVFGQPIAHSQSPHIHATFGRQEGLALDYRAIEASPGEFLAALEAFAAEGGVGANITAPHKEAAFALCTTLTSRARRAGAVNTLLRKGHRWHRPGP
jgi:shikimate dehydrogenase